MSAILNKIADFGLFVCERTANYTSSVTQDRLVQTAISCLERRLRVTGVKTNDSKIATKYFQCQLAAEEDEVFAVLFLNSRNQQVCFEKMFRGTINSCCVYPRVIVKKALELNATAIIVGHNHPSGEPEPSDSDISLTKKLKRALELFDLKLLDHIVVTDYRCVSFCESRYLTE